MGWNPGTPLSSRDAIRFAGAVDKFNRSPECEKADSIAGIILVGRKGVSHTLTMAPI